MNASVSQRLGSEPLGTEVVASLVPGLRETLGNSPLKVPLIFFNFF
jgi:hypothetical protein